MSLETGIAALAARTAAEIKSARAELAALRALIGAPPISTFARLASTTATRTIHSGHSLTDAYFSVGMWPGMLITMWESLFPEAAFEPDRTHHRSTMPGSATMWRWIHYNPDDVNARDDMDLFDALMITERGLNDIGVADRTTEVLLEDIFYEMRFAITAWQDGRKSDRPTEYILWSIWPSLTWANSMAILRDYEARFKFRADYITWKMHQLFPDLPPAWRVWICPGSLYMERLYADVQANAAPGFALPLYTLFHGQDGVDTIHPHESVGYGLACLVMTMLYQRDLRAVPGFFRPAYITAPQAEYLQRLAWEICTSYEPAGMGGTQGAAPAWTLAGDGDLFASLTTPAQWAAADHTAGVMPGTPAGNSPLVTTPASITGNTSPAGLLTLAIGAASGTPSPTATQQWFKDGAAIPGATGLTLDKAVHGVGSYTATVTWSNGVAPNATSTTSPVVVTSGGTAGAIPADRLIRWSAAGGYQGPPIVNGQAPFAPTGDFIRFGGRTGETAGPDQPGFVIEQTTTGVYLAMRARINQIQPRQGDELTILNMRDGANNGIVHPYRMELNAWHFYPTMLRTVYNPTGNWQDEVVISNEQPEGRDSFATMELWMMGTQMGIRLNGGAAQTAPMPVTMGTRSHLVLFRTYPWLTMDVKDLVLMGRMPSEAEAAGIRAHLDAL